jgi:hypothetical protein
VTLTSDERKLWIATFESHFAERSKFFFSPYGFRPRFTPYRLRQNAVPRKHRKDRSMVKNSKRIATIVVALAIMLTPLLQSASARENDDRPIVIPFTKWFISSTLMVGFIEDDPASPFEGSMLLNTPIPILPVSVPPLPAAFRHLEARYDVIGRDPSHSFSALIHGKTRVAAPGDGVLDGVITDGWYAGSQVHVEFGTYSCTYTTGACFIGTITILPDAGNNKYKQKN